MSFRLLCAAILVVAMSTTAFGRNTGNKGPPVPVKKPDVQREPPGNKGPPTSNKKPEVQREPPGNKAPPVSNKKPEVQREPPNRQDDFDGVPLPANSEKPTATQIKPAVVKIGNRFGVPLVPSPEKEKHNTEKKHDYSDMLGVSLMSGGTLMSLGTLALVAAASKALLLALAAIALSCLTSSGQSGAMSGDTVGASTVYEVVSRPQMTRGHGYSADVHHEPYSRPPPPPPKPTIVDYGYGNYEPVRERFA